MDQGHAKGPAGFLQEEARKEASRSARMLQRGTPSIGKGSGGGDDRHEFLAEETQLRETFETAEAGRHQPMGARAMPQENAQDGGIMHERVMKTPCPM